MSSRELEDRQERERVAWVASEIGVSADDLAEHDFEIDEIDGNDGAVYGHRVTFPEGTDPAFLATIKGLSDNWIDIGFPPGESEPDYE